MIAAQDQQLATEVPVESVEVLRKALALACARIADGPQKYHEANTPEGWAEVFVAAARDGKTTDEVLAAQPNPQRMTDEERAARQIDGRIRSEIYGAFVLLGAQSDLLCTVGSWKDSLPDADVLAGLVAWNRGALNELKERTQHYEISRPRSACSPASVPEKSAGEQ